MRYLTIITFLLVMLVGCDSSVTSNKKSSGGLLSAQQGGVGALSSTSPNDPLYSEQGYLNAANVPQAWQTTNGSSSNQISIISMGGVDNNHEDLQSRVILESSASSSLANNGGANPAAGIMGAATNNGKGIAGVNWASDILSYNIAKATTKKIRELPNGPSYTDTFVELNESAVGSAINNAANSGSQAIFLPLNWLLDSQVPEIGFDNLRVYPSYEVKNPYQLVYTNVLNIYNYIRASNKQNSNYESAISAVKNAYLDDAVVVGATLPYDGSLIGFPGNLASDHVVFTVGAANENGQPFQYSGTPAGDEVSNDPKDINLIAPGVDLETTLQGNEEYGNISGPFASAALGTGIVSLLQAAEGDLTPDDIAHILEKTALPLGGPGYGDQSGFGLIDAGAAMDYVETYDIKHGTIADADIEKIFSDRQITLLSSAWQELSSGVYFVDEYEVTFEIPLAPSPDNDLWFNAKGTLGWSPANPNDQNRFADVELFNDHAKITTYIYDVLSNTAGQTNFGWYPASPDNVQISYSYVGEIPVPPEPSLGVRIVGPPRLSDGETGTWDADVSRNDGSISYQWEIRYPGDTTWLNFGTSSSVSTYFNSTGGFSEAGLRVTVTSAGETASDQLNVGLYPPCRDAANGVSADSVQANRPEPCN